MGKEQIGEGIINSIKEPKERQCKNHLILHDKNALW